MSATLIDTDSVNRFIEDVRYNLVTLEGNLKTLGYNFANQNGAVQLASVSSLAALRSFERRFGIVSILFKCWYEAFHCVDFTQSNSQLYSTNGERLAGLGLNCPLIFLDIDTCFRTFQDMGIADQIASQKNGKTFIPIGGAASNCDPRGIWVPDTGIDPNLYDDGAGPVTMYAEVKVAIEAGGFPFWMKMFSRRRFTSPLGVTPDYKNILPVLIHNLRAI